MKNNTQSSKKNNLISKIKKFFFTNGWDPLPFQIKSISKTLAVISQNSLIEWLLPVAKTKSSGYFADIILKIEVI